LASGFYGLLAARSREHRAELARAIA